MADKPGNIRSSSWTQFGLTVAGIIVIAAAASMLRLRLDLTEDKRYTLSRPTKEILEDLSGDIYIQVYLDGDIPVPLKKLRRSVSEILDEFRVESGRKIDFQFINPAESDDAQKREARYLELYDKGLNPVQAMASDAEGGSVRKLVFPGMIINYNGIEVPVNFLKNNKAVSYEQNILNSIEGLEYELIQTISTVTSDTVMRIAFLEGQGELPEIEVGDVTMNLAKYFTIDRGAIGGKAGILDKYSAVIVAAPRNEFTEADKLVLDQYIMRGGKVLWLLEEVNVNSDSLAFGETVGLYKPLNIEDLLFRYGARVNPEIVQDINEPGIITLSVSTGAEQKQLVPAPWYYYPVLIPNQKHPLTRNINKVWGRYVNPIDTVGLDPSVKKTILLSTSAGTKLLTPPMVIRLKEADQIPDEKSFTKGPKAVAVLLEGTFNSAFRNRMTSELLSDPAYKVLSTSKPTRMIVVSDGDIIRNEVRGTGKNAEPLPLGQEKYTGEMFGNRDFIINCLNYLVDDHGLMELRSREMKMRLIDRQKVRSSKGIWQLVNIAGPPLIVILAGILYAFLRKRLYTTPQ